MATSKGHSSWLQLCPWPSAWDACRERRQRLGLTPRIPLEPISQLWRPEGSEWAWQGWSGQEQDHLRAPLLSMGVQVSVSSPRTARGRDGLQRTFPASPLLGYAERLTPAFGDQPGRGFLGISLLMHLWETNRLERLPNAFPTSGRATHRSRDGGNPSSHRQATAQPTQTDRWTDSCESRHSRWCQTHGLVNTGDV